MPTDPDPYLTRLLDAWNTTVQNPGQVLEVLYASESPSAGQLALQERFGWDEVQATSVLNMQFRRVTRSERDGFSRDLNHLEMR